MAEKLDEIDKSLKAQSGQLDFYKNDINSSVAEQVKESRDEYYGKLSSFKTVFTRYTESWRKTRQCQVEIDSAISPGNI
jgi:hypothetical protein